MLLKRIYNGKASQKKLITFAEEIQNKKRFIPGSPQYDKILEWSNIKKGPNAGNKFSLSKKMSPAAKIMYDAQRKGASPSAAQYKKEKALEKRIPGNYTYKDQNITYV